MDGLTTPRLPLGALAREASIHALMLGVMVPAMLWPSALLSVAGAGVLVLASAVCARLSPVRPHLREHIVDLWAMALLLVELAPGAAAGTGHGHAVALPVGATVGVVLTAWAAARFALVRRLRPSGFVLPVASAGITATGLVVMVALCT